jgi:hypothetical protein
MNKLAIVLSVLLFTTNCVAAGTSGFGNVGELKIGDGYIRISAKEGTNWNNPDKCNGDDVSHYLLLKDDTSTKNFSEIYSAILTAKVSSSPVNFYMKECDSNLPKISILYY